MCALSPRSAVVNGWTTHLERRGDSFIKSADPVYFAGISSFLVEVGGGFKVAERPVPGRQAVAVNLFYAPPVKSSGQQ